MPSLPEESGRFSEGRSSARIGCRKAEYKDSGICMRASWVSLMQMTMLVYVRKKSGRKCVGEKAPKLAIKSDYLETESARGIKSRKGGAQALRGRTIGKGSTYEELNVSIQQRQRGIHGLAVPPRSDKATNPS